MTLGIIARGLKRFAAMLMALALAAGYVPHHGLARMATCDAMTRRMSQETTPHPQGAGLHAMQMPTHDQAPCDDCANGFCAMVPICGSLAQAATSLAGPSISLPENPSAFAEPSTALARWSAPPPTPPPTALL